MVTLWFASRPLLAGEAAALHGSHNAADVGITVPVPMESVTVTASMREEAALLDSLGKKTGNVDDPRVRDVDASNPPSAGCWESIIIGAPKEGVELSVPLTFVAVE